MIRIEPELSFYPEYPVYPCKFAFLFFKDARWPKKRY
jgi:hypothetical protein